MVDPSQREALVILDPAAGGAQAAEAIRRQARVLQAAGDRLLVLDAAGADLDRIRTLPGVMRVLTGPATREGLPALEAGDALFVEAWLLRQREPKPARREGEGLPWDAPGHEPP